MASVCIVCAQFSLVATGSGRARGTLWKEREKHPPPKKIFLFFVINKRKLK